MVTGMVYYSNSLLSYPQVKCMTLFVTHYPLLANLEQSYPQLVGNFHMAYMSTEDSSKPHWVDLPNSHRHMNQTQTGLCRYCYMYYICWNFCADSISRNREKLAPWSFHSFNFVNNVACLVLRPAADEVSRVLVSRKMPKNSTYTVL